MLQIVSLLHSQVKFTNTKVVPLQKSKKDQTQNMPKYGIKHGMALSPRTGPPS